MREQKEMSEKFRQQKAVKQELFTIGQVCATSGLSRTMVMKLEQNGYLTPCEINAKTGYRYYDCFQVWQLQQYQLLRQMGLSGQSILQYYNGQMKPKELLEKMQEQLRLLQRGVDEFSLRIAKENNFTFSFLDLPEVTCYCGTGSFVYPADAAVFAYNLSHEVIAGGCRYLPAEPVFSRRFDTQTHPVGNPEKPYQSTVCIPIRHDKDDDSHADRIRTIPACRAFSILYYGTHEEYDAINKAHRLLWQEIERRGLRVTDEVRALCVVAPYVGLQFEPEDYVFRFAVPLEEDAQG